MTMKNERAYGFGSAAVLLVVCAVLSLLLCAGAYKNVSESGKNSDNLRGTLSYVATQVKSHDKAGCVKIHQGVLVLKESDGENEYELRIYAEGGKLLEEYAPAGAEKNPENAETIAEAESFSVKFIKSGLLLIRADSEEALIYLFAAGNEGGAK